ncbi:MAG: type II toxin-antitoxin system VapC family toxin [Nitrospirae bacterium]|nr:MAG: type II toxin-antitoxin system VapC family toxin [Nitrospirota bacterium]
MILDTSAVTAIFLQEPGYEVLLERLARARVLAMAAPSLLELGIVLSARLRRDATPLVDRFLREAGVETIAFGEDHWRVAVAAWRRFGRGRHPAGLNFGDCIAYAAARLADQPLLCVGDDFPKTDLRLA